LRLACAGRIRAIVCSRYMSIVAILTVLLVALALRTHNLAGESAWFDEIVSIEHLDAPNAVAFLQQERAEDPPMLPVYFALEYAWSRLVSSSVLGLRVLSIVLGMLTLLLLYKLACDMYGRAAGTVAAMCCALCPAQIYYSQEIRMYSLVMLLALVSVYTYLKAIRDGGRWWAAVHVAANVLLMATHLFAVLLVFVEGCFLIVFRWRELRRAMWWIAVHLVLLIPLGLWVAQMNFPKLDDMASWIELPTLRSLEINFLLYTGKSYAPPLSVYARAIEPGRLWLDRALMIAFMCAMARVAWYTLKRVADAKNDADGKPPRVFIEQFMLLLAWCAVPQLVLFAASYILQPCFVPRYLLYCSTPFYIFAGGAVASLRRPAAKLMSVSVLLILYASQLTFALSGPLRADWRSAAEVVETRGAPNDKVVVQYTHNARSFRFNSQIDERRITSGGTLEELCGIAVGETQNGPAVWVVIPKTGVIDERDFETCVTSHGGTFSAAQIPGDPILLVYAVSRGVPDKEGTM